MRLSVSDMTESFPASVPEIRPGTDVVVSSPHDHIIPLLVSHRPSLREYRVHYMYNRLTRLN
jgi:hypothetical protein